MAQQYLLYIASGLVLIMGMILFLLSEQTQKYFSWTIGIPLTAAFLGSGYLASFVLEFQAARKKLWQDSRVAVPGVLIFTSLTFVITLIHLDKFHLGSQVLITQIVTWAWILVYALVPVIMAIILVQQTRALGESSPPDNQLDRWFRGILLVQGIILVILGIGFLIVPKVFAPVWVWKLPPLAGRAVGAWLVGIGIVALHSMVENDWSRIRPAMIGFLLYGLLVLTSLLRYPDVPGLDFGVLKTWIFIIFAISLAFVGGFGSWKEINLE